MRIGTTLDFGLPGLCLMQLKAAKEVVGEDLPLVAEDSAVAAEAVLAALVVGVLEVVVQEAAGNL